MSSPAERMRGVGALVALLVLVIGVPWALLAWGGNPLPGSAPSLSWLTDPLSSSAVMNILVLVVWCAWLHFVLCVAREVVVQRRAARAHTAASGGHPLARRLVASVLLMAGTLTVTAQTAQAAESGAPAARTSVVTGAIADARSAGVAAQDAAEKAEADQALQQMQTVDAGVAKNKSAGTSHKLGLTYTVKPPRAGHHDSLWAIAERTLGDGRRWTDLYELNKDRVQDDGTSLQDADLIYPDWELVMPDDARGVDVRGLPESKGGNPLGGSGNNAGNTTGAAGGSENGENAAGDGAGRQHRTVGGAASGQDSFSFGAELGVAGGLIAAGVLLGLRRRRGWDGGPPRGRGTTLTDEQTLHLGADAPAAAVADKGLRQLSSHFAQPPASAPVLQSARVNADGFTARFTAVPEQLPPVGWNVLGDGTAWHGPADELADLRTSVASAYADTVVAGVDAGDHVLVNLRANGGSLSIGGEGRSVVSTLRAIAVGLATQPWGDRLTVIAVGLPGTPEALAADRLVAVDDAGGLAAACASVPSDRPVAVVSAIPDGARTAAEVHRVLGERTGTASVLYVDETAPDISIDPHGRLTSRSLRIFAEAVRLTESVAARLLSMYEASLELDSVLPAESEPVLVPEPAAVTIRMLGPLAVQTPGSVDPDRVDRINEILVYLALQPGGVHESVLAGAIWPRGVDKDVLDATMSRVGAALDPAGPVSDPLLQCVDGRWSLDLHRVRVDWHALRALVRAAERGDRPGERLEHALGLVDGPPLADLPAQQYAWLAATPAIRDIHLAVVGCAERLAEDAEPQRAEWALRAGLRAVPSCEALWQRLLRLAARTGRPIEPVADEMYATLGRHGSPLGAEATTDALVHELLPAYDVPARAGQLSA